MSAQFTVKPKSTAVPTSIGLLLELSATLELETSVELDDFVSLLELEDFVELEDLEFEDFPLELETLVELEDLESEDFEFEDLALELELTFVELDDFADDENFDFDSEDVTLLELESSSIAGSSGPAPELESSQAVNVKATPKATRLVKVDLRINDFIPILQKWI